MLRPAVLVKLLATGLAVVFAVLVYSYIGYNAFRDEYVTDTRLGTVRNVAVTVRICGCLARKTLRLSIEKPVYRLKTYSYDLIIYSLPHPVTRTL